MFKLGTDTGSNQLSPSAVDSGGAGGARAPPEFGGSEKGRSLISAYRSLAITTNTPGFKKLSTALICKHDPNEIAMTILRDLEGHTLLSQ